MDIPNSGSSRESRWGKRNAKHLNRADRYLAGLGLPGIKGVAEERAAIIAWDGHDFTSGLSVLGSLLAVVAAFAIDGIGVGILVAALGVLFTALVYLHGGRRVMAEAVLAERDEARPSLGEPWPAVQEDEGGRALEVSPSVAHEGLEAQTGEEPRELGHA